MTLTTNEITQKYYEQMLPIINEDVNAIDHKLSLNFLIDFNLIQSSQFDILNYMGDISHLNNIDKHLYNILYDTNESSRSRNIKTLKNIFANNNENSSRFRTFKSTQVLTEESINDDDYKNSVMTNIKNDMLKILTPEFENLLIIEYNDDTTFTYNLNIDLMTKDQINFFINQIYSFYILTTNCNNSHLDYLYFYYDERENRIQSYLINVKMSSFLNGKLGNYTSSI